MLLLLLLLLLLQKPTEAAAAAAETLTDTVWHPATGHPRARVIQAVKEATGVDRDVPGGVTRHEAIRTIVTKVTAQSSVLGRLERRASVLW